MRTSVTKKKAAAAAKAKPKGKPVMLLVYFQKTYLPENMKGTKPSMRQAYSRTVERFIAYTRGDVAIAKVTPEMLKGYLDWHLECNRGAPSTAYGDMIRIRKILRDAGRCDLRPPNARTGCKGVAPQAPPDVSLEIDKFYRDYFRVHRTVSKGYDQQVTLTLQSLRRFNRGPVLFDQLPNVLNKWLMELELTLAPRTIKSKRASIITLWYAAAEMGMCDPPRTRLIRKPKCARPAPDAWTLEQMQAIITSCRTFRGQFYSNGLDRGRFWEAFVRVCYDTALRRGDMFGVRFAHLEDVDGGIVLRSVQDKTGDGIVHRLHAATVEAIEAIREPKRELLFEWPHSSWTIHNHWQDMLDRAGLDPRCRRNGIQKIRRTSASHLERENTGAATAHLGHRCGDMARMHYLDPKVSRGVLPMPPAID